LNPIKGKELFCRQHRRILACNQKQQLSKPKMYEEKQQLRKAQFYYNLSEILKNILFIMNYLT